MQKKRILRNMRISTLFVIFTLTSTQLLLGHNASGQGKETNPITLHMEQELLREVFAAIEEKADVVIMYENTTALQQRRVSIIAENSTVASIMNELLAGQPFHWSIRDNVIRVEKGRVLTLPTAEEVIHAQAMVRGRVTDSLGKPLFGATVRVLNAEGKRTTLQGLTDHDGYFLLKNVPEDALIEISYIGYLSRQVKTSREMGILVLQSAQASLNEVEVSTGYQTLPKERATGSFVFLDSALLNRRVSTNILDRLDGVTSGLVFNKNPSGANNPAISIRGRGTIFANASPLVVLDNFPYEGDIQNINPQDVESITVLKDAAAASIWGTRAGNGVIVITTKKGSNNQKPAISFNSNATFIERPDLYYQPQLSSAEFIEVERFLFEKGKYNSALNNSYAPVSPAVEILAEKRAGRIGDALMEQMLDSLAAQDIRADLGRYIYRPALNQQYQVSVSGGNSNQRYFVSGGLDKNKAGTQGNSYVRLTLNANNTYKLIGDKLELFTGLVLTSSTQKNNSRLYTNPTYPYERLVGNDGEHLAVSDGILRKSYTDTAGKGNLLDWHFRPLDELSAMNKNVLTDYRLNTNLTFRPVKVLNIALQYLFQKGNSSITEQNASGSYYTRNMVNTYSLYAPSSEIIRPVSIGDIVSNSYQQYTMHNGRLQVGFDQSFNEKHELHALAGAEVRQYRQESASVTLYGFNPETLTNTNAAIDFSMDYPYYYGTGTGRIPTGLGNRTAVDRSISYYFTGSYSYVSRYVFSLSARKDESNLFGVSANRKGVPLWSVGASWNIADEAFYVLDWLPILKFRTTFGYNGNIDKSVTAFLTASNQGLTNVYGAPYLSITNPPNPSLQWEKIRNINIGLEFGSRGNRLTGSVEYYIKKGMSLIGNSPVAPQTGLDVFRGNTADLRTKGIDLVLHSDNLRGTLGWQTDYLFSYVNDKVTDYEVKASTNYDIINANYNNPIVGYPYNALFAFPWRGLDAEGNPQSIADGGVSINYTAIRNSDNIGDMVYLGSTVPKVFGSFRNTFIWKDLSFSFNILYKMGYYFRRPSLDYGTLVNGGFRRQVDYGARWQQPGDEEHTSVPSFVYPVNTARASIYNLSEILVEKGDHIRLQDIRLAYTLHRADHPHLPFGLINVYAYASNLGILWKSTKTGMDPDAVTGFPAMTSYAFGMKINF